jgi:tRNA A-37 threonylcarbamoyl transferase component Bud32
MGARDEQLLGLLERWQDGRKRGFSPKVAELCAGCPELADDLQRQIAGLLGGERWAGETADIPGTSRRAASGIASPEQSPLPARGTSIPVVPGYERLEYLGGGGMGDVWKAYDPALHRDVALKLVRADQLTETARARLLIEARAVAQLDHPNVVKVHAVGECRQPEDGSVVPYIALEYVPGPTLARRAANQTLAPREAGQLVALLARAVHHAHERGIVHRDLKPENVLLAPAADVESVNTPAGCPKVTDFGLARPVEGPSGLTQSGAIVGTPAYMAPEQTEGGEAGPAADVYALGGILYRLLAGRPPFEGDSVLDVLHKVRHGSPTSPRSQDPTIPAALESVCLRCLARQPGDRYASAKALAEALEGWLAGGVTTTDLATAVGGRIRRRRLLAGAVIGLAGLLLAVLLAGPFRPVSDRDADRTEGKRQELAAPGHRGQRPSPRESESVAPKPGPTYRGRATALVWRRNPDGKTAQRLKLTDPEALPLRRGDHFRIEAEVKPAAYLYVVAIDPDGKAALLAPTSFDAWDGRGKEQPTTEVSLPADRGKGIRLPPGKQGMVTVLLIARARPWEVGAERLKALFADLPRQWPIQDARSAVWFEGGRARTRSSFELGDLDDPVLVTQGLLKERLRDEADFTSAVSFAWAD